MDIARSPIRNIYIYVYRKFKSSLCGKEWREIYIYRRKLGKSDEKKPFVSPRIEVTVQGIWRWYRFAKIPSYPLLLLFLLEEDLVSIVGQRRDPVPSLEPFWSYSHTYALLPSHAQPRSMRAVTYIRPRLARAPSPLVTRLSGHARVYTQKDTSTHVRTASSVPP